MSSELAKKHYVALDGLRAYSALAVFAFHAQIPFFSQGGLGVYFFFVLSGFLITNILLDSKTATNFFSVFYARRFLRIFPIYYLVLFIVIIIAVLNNINVSACWYYIFYLQNIILAQSNYKLTTFPGWLDHTWTLAIEEQFYIFFPLLVRFLNRRALTIACLAIIFISVFNRYVFYKAFGWGHTFNSLDYLAAGALLAIGLRQVGAKIIGAFLIFAFVLLVSICMFSVHPMQPILATALLPLICLTVLVLVTCSNNIIRIVFENKFAVYIGKISYGIYLYHVLVIILWEWLLAHCLTFIKVNTSVSIIIELAATIGVAAISFQWFESKILKLKDKFKYNFVPAS